MLYIIIIIILLVIVFMFSLSYNTRIIFNNETIIQADQISLAIVLY